MITISLLTREMLRLLHANGIRADHECEELLKPGERISGADVKQRHVDFILERDDLLKSLDDLSENILWPSANHLAVYVPSRVKKCIMLPLPDGITSARHSYDNISVRGTLEPVPIMDENDIGSGRMLARFDIAFCEAG